MKKTGVFYFLIFFTTGFLLLYVAHAHAVSDEARRHYDRGLAAVEMAKIQADYEDAITEFEQAARLAPDWPDVYYQLGMVQDKIGRFEDAWKNLRRYLNLAPQAKDREQVTQFINKIEYKKDKAEKSRQVIRLLTTSGGFKCISNCNDLTGNRANAFRDKDGKLEARIYILVNQEQIWVPVIFDGKTIEYKYTWYGCSSVISSKLGHPDQCPWNVSIKSEIVSTAPLRLKNTETWVRSWGNFKQVLEAELEKVNSP